MNMKRNKAKVYRITFFTGLSIFILIFLLTKIINTNIYQSYAADKLYLVFSDWQPIIGQSENLDFLLADLKTATASSSQSAVINFDAANKNKDFNSLLPLASSVYIDIFSNQSAGPVNTTIFKNDLNFKMPFEIKSYLSAESILKVLYSAQTQTLEFIYPGQNLVISGEKIKLNDISIFKFLNIQPGSLIKIGAQMINLSGYGNDSTISLDNLFKNNIKVYRLKTDNLLGKENYSFESGLWANDVADCSAYLSGRPDLGMALKNDASDGHKSLELSATNHFACTLKSFPIKLQSDMLYKLTFDYKNTAGKKVQYYYNLQNDSGQTQEKFDSFSAADSNWHTFETIISPDVANITNFNLYFYAPSDGSQRIVNQYDNVQLKEFSPKGIYSYYLYSKPAGPDLSPKLVIKEKTINAWKSQISLNEIKNSVLLVYPAKYSRQWKIYAAKKYGIFARLTGQTISEKDHFEVNDYGNLWRLDFNDLCIKQGLCEKNSDGTYRLDLIMEKDFNQLVNFIFLLAGLGFVFIAFYFRKKM